MVNREPNDGPGPPRSLTMRSHIQCVLAASVSESSRRAGGIHRMAVYTVDCVHNIQTASHQQELRKSSPPTTGRPAMPPIRRGKRTMRRGRSRHSTARVRRHGLFRSPAPSSRRDQAHYQFNQRSHHTHITDAIWASAGCRPRRRTYSRDKERFTDHCRARAYTRRPPWRRLFAEQHAR